MSVPQIYKGDPRPHITPCVMVLSAMGLKFGGVWVFANHIRKNKRKTNVSRIFVRCAACYACWSWRLNRSRCRWHTHLRNHGYFENGENLTQVLGPPLYICRQCLIITCKRNILEMTFFVNVFWFMLKKILLESLNIPLILQGLYGLATSL